MLDENKKIYNILSVNCLYQDDQPVPVIKLQGKWLQKLGFEPGDTLVVERQPGMLVIRPLFIAQSPPDSSTASAYSVMMI